MHGGNSQRIQIFVEVFDQKTQLGHRQGPGTIGIKLCKSFLVGEKVLLQMIRLSHGQPNDKLWRIAFTPEQQMVEVGSLTSDKTKESCI